MGEERGERRDGDEDIRGRDVTEQRQRQTKESFLLVPCPTGVLLCVRDSERGKKEGSARERRNMWYARKQGAEGAMCKNNEVHEDGLDSIVSVVGPTSATDCAT